MPLIEITSPDDPRIAEYVGVREAELRQERYDAPGGLFIAEGELVFRRLVNSTYATRSVLLTPTRLTTVRDAIDALPPETPIYLVDQRVMNGIVGFNIHRGLLALGAREAEPPLETLLADAACIVVLEDLVNHDNVGGIFRNVAALAGITMKSGGAKGGAVLLSPRCCDPLYRKAIRVSIGWALGVPFARSADWPGDIARMRQAGYRVLALHPDAGARDVGEVAAELSGSPQKIALIVGTEGPGLSADAIRNADECIRIPMRGRDMFRSHAKAGEEADFEGVDSLNVGVATAIALHRLTAVLPDR